MKKRSASSVDFSNEIHSKQPSEENPTTSAAVDNRASDYTLVFNLAP